MLIFKGDNISVLASYSLPNPMLLNTCVDEILCLQYTRPVCETYHMLAVSLVKGQDPPKRECPGYDTKQRLMVKLLF